MRRVKQRTDAHCGPAVLEMLLSYLDIKVHQDAIIDAAKVSVKLRIHGMTVPDMAKAIKLSVPQAQFWYKHRASIADISRLLTKYRYPVGIEWQGLFGKYADGEDDGHYGVVIKIDSEQEKIRITDPFFARDRRINLDRFKDRWWDVNLVVNSRTKKSRSVKDHQMIFIVTHIKYLFPVELGMKKG